ncbi:MAG: esterase-like activity of phytase family protein [Methyloligellaceae bacterium]
MISNSSRILRYGGPAFALLMALGFPAEAQKPQVPELTPQAIEIEALRIDFDPERPDRKTFGKLIWLGGVELHAKSPVFGGYSGLALDETGTRLLAVSDGGHWLTAEITTSGRRVTGLANARVGPLLARDGRRLTQKQNADAEAVSPVRPGHIQGDLYIAFERNHRIGRFPQTPKTIGAPKRYLRLPADMKRSTTNKGLEALTVMRAGPFKGRLVAFTERLLDKNGNHVGWILGGRSAEALKLKRLNGFDITDLAALPGGGLLVLERRFRFSEGVQMRIRRIAAGALRPGKLLTGEVLLHARDNLTIDNMEGIAVHRGAKGETIVTLISDDNFNRALQRTVLLQFALP